LKKPLAIAIDGPAGSGKSTVARLVAERLGYIYVDTGAMYRAAAWKSLQEGILLSDENAIVEMIHRTRMWFEKCDHTQRIFVDGTDVSEAIRTPEVSALSSPVSAIPGVRERLVELQRQMAAQGGVVMEGRDIGTVVLPHAEVKVFLTASPKVRAQRRLNELLAKGYTMTLEEVERDLAERDLRDSTRAVGPLKQAPDAVVINTDRMSIEEVVNAVLELVRAKDC